MTTDTPDSTVQDTGPDRTAPMSAVDAARVAGVHEKTIRRAISAGELTATKVKGAYRIDAEALAAWQAAQEQPDSRADTEQDRTPPDKSGPADAVRSADRATERLIARLENENEHLRGLIAERDRALEARSKELAAERERGDVLQREALARIEALTAGIAPTDAPDRAGEPIETTMTADAYATPSASQTATDATAAWSELTRQLIEELGMTPDAARIAAAQEIGLV